MSQQSQHIQPAPSTIFLLFLTQFVVRACIDTLFVEMANGGSFACSYPTESSPLL